MGSAVETTIHLSGESARRPGELAVLHGVSEDLLVTEALELLFRRSDTDNETIDASELLRRMETELGPFSARSRPPLEPAQFVVNHSTPAPSVRPNRSGSTYGNS